MRRHDEGVSETIGTVLMIAVVVVMAGAVYYFVGRGTDAPKAPSAIALSQNDAPSATSRTFTVTTVAQPIHWNELVFKLSGATMTYDDTLVLPATYCVALSGSTCVASNQWNPSALVEAGQQLVIHDGALTGKVFLIMNSEANAAIFSVSLA